MTAWIITNWLPLVLFVLAGALTLGRGPGAALGAMGLCVLGGLTGLVWGWTLEQLSVGVLALCVLAFRPLAGKEGKA